MPSTPALDLSVTANISFTRLPLNTDFTNVAKVLFCFIQVHGRTKKFTFAAAQAHPSTSGSQEVFYMSVGHTNEFDRRYHVNEDLFCAVLHCIAKHVTHLVFHTAEQAMFAKSLFPSHDLPPFKVFVLGDTLSRCVTGSSKYKSLRSLLTLYAKSFDSPPAPLRYCLNQYEMSDQDVDLLLRYRRLALINAKAMYFLYDRFRSVCRTVVVLPERIDPKPNYRR